MSPTSWRGTWQKEVTKSSSSPTLTQSCFHSSTSTLSVVPVGRYRSLAWLAACVPLDFPRWILQHLLGNIRAARCARQILRCDPAKFDAVHSHGALATILLRSAVSAGASTVPLVYTEHDSTPWSCRYRSWPERIVRRCVYRQINLRACRAATVVVTNFPALANEISARAGIPRSRLTTIENATAAGGQTIWATAASVKARHGFDRYCLFVGSLIDRKGPDILLRALSHVKMPCIFVGDGPMRSTLERLARRTGLADRVVFTGALERRAVSSYYSGAEALVLPSVSEGVPLVAVEALAAGVPVVASNLTGIASVIRHRENGLLVNPGDQAALAQALALIEADHMLRAVLRQGALDSKGLAETWPDVVSKLCTVYAERRPVVNVPSPRDGEQADRMAGPLTAAGLALGFSPALALAPAEGSTSD